MYEVEIIEWLDGIFGWIMLVNYDKDGGKWKVVVLGIGYIDYMIMEGE